MLSRTLRSSSLILRSLVATRWSPPVRLQNRFLPPRRYLATPPPQVNQSDLSMEQYHQLSDKVLDVLLADLETLVDELQNDAYDVDYHSGVLTLKLGEKGIYVINKQPPNKQIWLSSPISGPKRFDYTSTDGTWRYGRDNQSLSNLINTELKELLELEVSVTANNY